MKEGYASIAAGQHHAGKGERRRIADARWRVARDEFYGKRKFIASVYVPVTVNYADKGATFGHLSGLRRRRILLPTRNKGRSA